MSINGFVFRILNYILEILYRMSLLNSKNSGSLMSRGEITGSDMFINNIEIGMPMRSFVDQSRKSSYQLESKQFHDYMLYETNQLEQIDYFDPYDNVTEFNTNFHKDQTNIDNVYNKFVALLVHTIQQSKKQSYCIDLIHCFSMIELLFMATNKKVFSRIFPELNKNAFHQEYIKFVQQNNLISKKNHLFTLLQESNKLNRFFIQQNVSLRSLTILNDENKAIIVQNIQNALERINPNKYKQVDIHSSHFTMCDILQSIYFIHTSIETEVSECGKYLYLHNGEYHVISNGSILKIPLNDQYMMLIMKDKPIDNLQTLIMSNEVFKLIPVVKIPFIQNFSKIDCRCLMTLFNDQSHQFDISNIVKSTDSTPTTMFQYNNVGVYPYTHYQNIEKVKTEPNIDLSSDVYLAIYNMNTEIVYHFGYIK
jgi:hypothetical protein